MRSLIVRVLGTALSFYITACLVKGFQLDATWVSYITASAIFVILNWLILPLVKLLLLPINLLTLGLFRWVASVIVLYFFDLIYSGLAISSYYFSGFSTGWIAIPAGNVSLFWTLIFSSLSISLSYSLISSLLLPEG